VATWLDDGGGVDARCAEHKGAMLLMAAAQGGHNAMVQMLLQRGASVNLQGSHGHTALICAADKGHLTVVRALLDAKADTLLQTTGINGYDSHTALTMAEDYKHAATAQLLRQYAKRQATEAKARSSASAAQAAATADAMAAELGEEAAKKKKKKAKKGKAKAAPKATATGTGNSTEPKPPVPELPSQAASGPQEETLRKSWARAASPACTARRARCPRCHTTARAP